MRIRDHARALGAGTPGVGAVDPLRVASDVMDRQGVPLLRLVLASAGLLIIYIDPSEPDRLVPLTYTTLALYTIYSAVLYVVASTYRLPLSRRYAHWLDVVWHTVLISMSSGTNSLFLFFYYFDILVASFRCGMAEGLRVTGASAFLAASVGYIFLPAEFDLNRVLLRPLALLVLGYMMAYWGGQEIQLTRRLALLRDMTALRNPRFGVHAMIAAAVGRLRRYYNADSCLLMIADAADASYWLYRARAGEEAREPERCDADMAAMLLMLPPTEAVLFDKTRRSFSRHPTVHRVDVVTRHTSREASRALLVVASALEADALATVPFRYHSEAVGRLYVVAQPGTFQPSDLEFLSHAMDTTLRVAENVRLVDRLASEAADVERRRIARGIHDTVIQPFIGLQLGLRAIRARSSGGNREADRELEQFLALIDEEVRRLRSYVSDLKSSPEERVTLVTAVRRFARQFSSVTSIEVAVEGPADLPVNDRLAGELFEMAAEALSNVRRHTTANRAEVRLEHADGTIGLWITNETQAETPSFSPRSLTERAEALGGTVRVHRAPEATRVQIAIPL